MGRSYAPLFPSEVKQMKSIRSVYKIGNGPSSSHTVGPYNAARIFRERYPFADRYQVTLYGSLALTGEGHGTEKAILNVIRDAEIIFDKKTEDLPHPNTMLSRAWKEGRLEFYTAAVFEANISAPATYKVFVNGKELNASHLSGDIAESELNQYVTPYAEIPGTANYQITGLYEKPVVTAKDYLGNDCECVYDENKDTYTVNFIKDFDGKDELSEYALKFTSTFANYVSQDAGAYALDKYFPSGSKQLSYIKRNSSRQLYTKHGKVEIKNGEIKDITVFSDDVVYMEVYVEQHMQMYFGSKEPEVLKTDAHVYFVKIKGKWYVGGIQY